MFPDTDVFIRGLKPDANAVHLIHIEGFDQSNLRKN